MAILSMVFSTSTFAQTYELLYENESNCAYKVEVYDQNGSACSTTQGPIPALGSGTLMFQMPCGNGTLTGIRIIESNGNFSAPTTGDNPCTGEEDIYGSFTCQNASFEIALRLHTSTDLRSLISMRTISLIVLIAPMFSWAQLQNSQWYFGDGAGIDFTNSTPIAHDNNTMVGYANSASIADANGNLLFYCDTMVWNAQHQPMLNGYGLKSAIGSSQPCLILPKPGSTEKYIIVTTPAYAPVAGNENDAYWNEVDMSLDGGLGAITQKNVFLMDSAAEKVAATMHENGVDYWVLTHRVGSNTFIAHLLTSNGFTQTVQSNVGPEYSKWLSGSGDGTIQFSNDGSMVVNTLRRSGLIEIFDFENSTGLVSNYIHVSDEIRPQAADFSSNGQFIYCTSSGFIGINSKLIQFDISSNDSVQIAATRTELYESPSPSAEIVHYVTQALDSKLYVAVLNADTIGVINDPDLPGLSCNYVHKGFALVPGTECRWGLPNFTKQYAQVVDAVEEEAVVVDLEVYPVPAKEQFTLNMPELWNGQQLELRLFDLRGRIVRAESFIGPKRLIVERKDLGSGIYPGAVYAAGSLLGEFRVVLE